VAAFGTIPGGVYTLLEKFVLRSNTAVMGARYAHYTLARILGQILTWIVYGYSSCFPPKS
jgi:hypothetical protein